MKHKFFMTLAMLALVSGVALIFSSPAHASNNDGDPVEPCIADPDPGGS